MSAEVPVTAAATFCATLVDEWRILGLKHVVICPGSRSTPMALAMVDAMEHGVTIHVCLDERSAGFLAVGLARATRRPVPVLTTSGTATANLHPAVVEAHEDAVPLIACTADRPPELQGVGAAQTTNQQQLYGSAVRLFVDAGVPDETDPATWRALGRNAWECAVGADRAPGPVQVDLPLREPLTGRSGSIPRKGVWLPPKGPPFTRIARWVAELAGRRVLVVAGPPVDKDQATAICAHAARLGWPVLIDPRVGVAGRPEAAVHRADLLLRSDRLRSHDPPEVVMRLGALPASKVVGQWLDGLGAQQVAIDPWGRRFDPGGSLASIAFASYGYLFDPLALLSTGAPAGWGTAWGAAEATAEAVLARELSTGPLTEPAIARLVTQIARDQPAELFVSSSMPIRDVEWFGVPDGPAIYANRGANGIDGITSTAAGVALGSGRRTIALLGDLAFLHDTNGLLILNSEQPDLTLVVVDNGGGGIFHFLPQRDALDAARFERLYGTPQNVDLVAVAEAHGVPAQRCDDREAFESALRATTKGPRVLVVTTDRDANVAEHRRLQDLAVAAVDATLPPSS